MVPLQKFKEKASKLYMDMAAFMKSKTMSAPGTLKEYSPWMADFQGMDYQEQLEIPGTFLKHRYRDVSKLDNLFIGFYVESAHVVSTMQK